MMAQRVGNVSPAYATPAQPTSSPGVSPSGGVYLPAQPVAGKPGNTGLPVSIAGNTHRRPPPAFGTGAASPGGGGGSAFGRAVAAIARTRNRPFPVPQHPARVTLAELSVHRPGRP